MSPAERIADILRTDEKSARRFCYEVQRLCMGFAPSLLDIAKCLERNPGLKHDPRIVAEKLVGKRIVSKFGLSEIKRVAHVLRTDDAHAREFCNKVQRAFSNRRVSLKTIAWCVERNSHLKITPELVVAELRGKSEFLDSASPAPTRTRKGTLAISVTKSSPEIDAIKKKSGDWETD